MTADPSGMLRTAAHSPDGTQRRRVPDILDVIAALSSDAIPTPPVLARALLDLLPEEVWTKPHFKWLDPACKSGSILREAAKRLMVGLADWEPDADKRAEHILRHMLHGCGITQVHAEMTRRSVYISRDASGEHAAVKFSDSDGRIPFVDADHNYKTNAKGQVSGSCDTCGAPPSLERGESRENYAYAFIHNAYPTKDMIDMQFDVVVGNPPYQIGVEDNNRTKPIYQYFVQRSKELNPRYIAMITPSRWFTGGFGLDAYRTEMIHDRRLRAIVDNPKLFDCFPGVEIKGGVSYFLWDREHNGDCSFSTRVDGVITESSVRDLRKGRGVVIRSDLACAIVEKVEAAGLSSMSERVSSQKPFGLLSNFDEYTNERERGHLRLYVRSREEAWIDPALVTQGLDLVAPIKVMTPEAGDGHGRTPARVTGTPFVAEEMSVCTQTFLAIRGVETELEAQNLVRYLSSKFARFLVHQRKASQHTTSDTYLFVPWVPLNVSWSDPALYDHFGLDEAEIGYIESQIASLDQGPDRAATDGVDG
jgi:site-specific DNA-methyltransferase (adenine-specific)